MSLTKLFLLLLCGCMLMPACKSKKTPVLSGDEPVAVSDFIDFFPTLTLGYQVGDTLLDKKEKDSLLISYKIFTQFVPDTVLTKVFGKGNKPRIWALGKAPVSKAETYLLVKAGTSAKKHCYCWHLIRRRNLLPLFRHWFRIIKRKPTSLLALIDGIRSRNRYNGKTRMEH